MEYPAPVVIDYSNSSYRNNLMMPSQAIPESKKTPLWYYKNIEYIISFYNQPVNNIFFQALSNAPGFIDTTTSDELPVNKMIRMIRYYLGDQPNMNYNHLTQNISTTNLQAKWIKGQDVSEFINFFRGGMLQKLSNAQFTGKSISKSSNSKREELANMLMLKHLMNDEFQKLEAQGVKFNPANGKQFEFPEEIQEWMDKEYTPKEKLSVLSTYMANGLWNTNAWLSKALQAFMYTAICQSCAIKHYVKDGRGYQKVIAPYQLIQDNRVDDDYGRYDNFIGTIENETSTSLLALYPELLPYKEDIENMAKDRRLGNPYNQLTGNISWWTYGTNVTRNTVTTVEVYWRTLRENGKIKAKNQYGVEIVRKATKDEVSDYQEEDLHRAILVGNKYLIRYGYTDNVVEDISDRAKPMFPIQRFMPNTFMGQSVSEVSRVTNLQDMMDMLNFKVSELIGRAKGKIYIIDGSKYGDGATAKEFLQDAESMGIHVATHSGEIAELKDREKGVEVIDWTLDPGIQILRELINDYRAKMGKILSTSEISLGQQTTYVGLGTQQNTISQNSLGTSYIFSGFLDFLVINMRYAVNQLKNVKTIKERDTLELLVGKEGVVYLEFFKDMRFEDLFVMLNINDTIDDEAKKRILTVAQADAQNGKISTRQFVQMELATSLTEVKEMFVYEEKKNEKKAQDERAREAKIEALQAQQTQQAAEMLATKQMISNLFVQLSVQDRKNLGVERVAEIKAGATQPNQAIESNPPMPVPNPMQAQQPQQQEQVGQPQQDPLGLRR